LIKKRAYDLSAATGKETTVWFNEEKIAIKDFTDYMTLFIGNQKKVVYKTENGRWEVGFALCPYDQSTQISFVNAICTEEGGSHVTHVLDPVLTKITNELQTKAKGITIKKQYIKDNVIIFIKALIENPSFNSQLKRKLETKVGDFGSRCDIPDDIIKKIAKLGICDNVMDIAKAKDMKDAMKKIDGTKNVRLSDIKKLDDANLAGTNKSMDCTLILTEGDSVTGDTPLVLLNEEKQIIIKNIEDLANEYYIENGKEYGTSNLKVWSDNGWTKIKHIMKHRTSKQIYRILTHTGCVDVTEDHSLLDDCGKEIKPSECMINNKLLHSFPLFEENKIEIPIHLNGLSVKELWIYASSIDIRYYQNMKKTELIRVLEDYKNKSTEQINYNTFVSEKEAYVMGLFFADGSCGIYKNTSGSQILTWAITNTDLNLLNKSIEIMIKLYGENFKIYKMKTKGSGFTINSENLKQQYKLCLNGGNKTKFIIEKYRKMFYYKKWKYIDSIILNSTKEIRQEFFNGYYDGDGQHNSEARMKMDINGKITAQCVYTLCNGLGYKTSINHNSFENYKDKIYTIGVSKGKFQKDPIIIKKIIKLPNEEQYVYDLETESHHFQAGIGQLIVHNSAKSLALNGITSAGGRNKWGVFPLRGKFINVRTATASQIVKNEEILAVNRILGLKEGMTDIKKLRYGRVMIMTDSDVDGHHIKGLLINYFTMNWPEIVEQGLLECMITPLIKVFKGNNLLKQFYNLNDYKKWIEDAKPTGTREKYYKGLGTSTAIEAKDYFANLSSNRKKYKFNEKRDSDIMIRTFDKNYADARKDWISGYLKDPKEVDYTKTDVQVEYFINRELVQFSTYDNVRSIPNIIDGFKPSQRKILFGCLKKKLFLKIDKSGEIKVSQLSGYISEHSEYHHGETSLQGTIINMAQDFVGSNNLNLLLPIGNFGSRQGGGSDAASPRYIYTALRPEVKILFDETDCQLLNYLEEDGTKIEPEFYVPIIPMLLLNGSTGIGTGWSTNIPCFKLEDIVHNIRLLLEDEDAVLKEMNPYYKGFKGHIIKETENKWKSIGVIKYINKTTIEIVELPVGVWKEDYKEHLDKLLDSNLIKSVIINDDDEKKNVNDVCYQIKLNDFIEKTDLPELISFFKLEKNINGSNMVAFDENNIIQKYESVEDILWTFFKYRLEFYNKRHAYLKKTLEDLIKKISEKLRFVLLVIDDKIVVFKKKKIEIAAELTRHEFEEQDYLLGMPLYKFTLEEVDDLKKELTNLKNELNVLCGKSGKDLWENDLDKLIDITT
jgi:DNA gyrase/topoisomerase IV subunit B